MWHSNAGCKKHARTTCSRSSGAAISISRFVLATGWRLLTMPYLRAAALFVRQDLVLSVCPISITICPINFFTYDDSPNVQACRASACRRHRYRWRGRSALTSTQSSKFYCSANTVDSDGHVQPVRAPVPLVLKRQYGQRQHHVQRQRRSLAEEIKIHETHLALAALAEARACTASCA